MKRQVFPPWYFDATAAQGRADAAGRMYQALSDGNPAAYRAALADWQACSGGLKGCPGVLATCAWNPPDTDSNATVVTVNGAGQYLMGGKLLPFEQ